GMGALTKELLPLVDEMHAVELDRDLIPPLEKACKNLGNLHVYQANVLDFDFTQLVAAAPGIVPTTPAPTIRTTTPASPTNIPTINIAKITSTIPAVLRIVGNLPYHISTPILFHLIDQLPVIKDMHLMLQKEVVERMAAQPGSKTYGRLSVM